MRAVSFWSWISQREFVRAGMMSISPCTAEPVWLSPPRRHETFAAAPTWMATRTLCSSGTSRTPTGSERSCKASPLAVWPYAKTCGRPVLGATFRDDLRGLIFPFTRGRWTEFPSARLLHQCIERTRSIVCGFKSGTLGVCALAFAGFGGSFRCGVTAVAGAIEGVADDVADESGAEDFDGVRARVDDVDEGIRGD